MDLHGRVREFLERTLGAMGVPLEVAIEDSPDSVRLDLSGAGGEVLLQRRGEALDALQHIVNTAFRRELDGDRSFVVDCLGYRRGKDAELQQMARFSMEKAKTSGAGAGNRSAESLRPASGAHHCGRRSAVDVGEYRRRVSEDGDHFAAALSRLRPRLRPFGLRRGFGGQGARW